MTAWMTRAILAAVLALLLINPGRAQQAAPTEGELGVPYLIPPGAVDLSDKQREAVTSLRRDLHDRYCTLSGELLFAQEDVRAQLVRRPPNADAIAEARRRVAELQDRMREARREAVKEAEALLAPEQREVLANWRAGERGAAGASGTLPYTIRPGIESDEPDIEDLEDPTPTPRY